MKARGAIEEYILRFYVRPGLCLAALLSCRQLSQRYRRRTLTCSNDKAHTRVSHVKQNLQHRHLSHVSGVSTGGWHGVTSSAPAHRRGVHSVIPADASNVGPAPSASSPSSTTPSATTARASVAKRALVPSSLEILSRGRLFGNKLTSAHAGSETKSNACGRGNISVPRGGGERHVDLSSQRDASGQRSTAFAAVYRDHAVKEAVNSVEKTPENV